MMKGGKSSVLAFAEKCKNILASNWQGNLNTIKADAKGSKEEIYTSKVKYFVMKGKPYIFVPEGELHNVNAIIDERGSFAVTSPFPGPLAHLLKSIRKMPARVAMVGDVRHLKDEKANAAGESLRELILADQRTVQESSYFVSQISSSSFLGSAARCANLEELLQGIEQYCVYKFNVSSCMYIDNKGSIHEVKLGDFEKAEADSISLFSAGLIDGINESEMRRRALVLFCITFIHENAKDAFLLSVDRKGFDVLGKVMMSSMKDDGSREFQWKELRFTFKDEVRNVDEFCQKLLEMEEEAVKNFSLLSGI